MKKLVIFGSGGHARVVFSEIIKLKKYQILGFVDDFKDKGEVITTYKNKKFYNLGKIKDIIKRNNNFAGIIGIGLNYIRSKVVNEIKQIDKNFIFQEIISKDAIISNNVHIAEGAFIVSGAIINNDSKIGAHCIINTSCSVDHDNYFGDFSSIGPGVITGGFVEIGECSYIGMGSVIKNNIKISSNSVIGFGSLVNKNCSKNSVYYGTPIKKIRNRKINDNYL